MSIHNDYIVDNQDGASLLTDLNSLLAALKSFNSNDTAPVTYADYQLWVDTSGGTNLLKLIFPNNTPTPITICDIDTGEFFDVYDAIDTAALTAQTITTDADDVTGILSRDSTGNISNGDQTSGDLVGSASYLGAAGQDADFFLNGKNSTGVPTGTSTTGLLQRDSLDLSVVYPWIYTAVAGHQVIDYAYYKPLRSGVITVSMDKRGTQPINISSSIDGYTASVTWTAVGSYTTDFTIPAGGQLKIDFVNWIRSESSIMNFGGGESGFTFTHTDTNELARF